MVRRLVLGALALSLAGCCGDAARRDDVLRRRQYELDQREARLSAAEKKFKQCVVERYEGADPGLEPAAAAPASVGPAGSTAAGGIGPGQLEEIHRVERIGEAALISCYEEEMERRGDKKLEGKVMVNILIGADGIAQKVQIGEASTLQAPRALACMTKAIKTWEFPTLSAPSWYSTTFSFSPAY